MMNFAKRKEIQDKARELMAQRREVNVALAALRKDCEHEYRLEKEKVTCVVCQIIEKYIPELHKHKVIVFASESRVVPFEEDAADRWFRTLWDVKDYFQGSLPKLERPSKGETDQDQGTESCETGAGAFAEDAEGEDPPFQEIVFP